jgi:hypothetical protein
MLKHIWQDFVRALKAFVGLPVVTPSESRMLRKELRDQEPDDS